MNGVPFCTPYDFARCRMMSRCASIGSWVTGTPTASSDVDLCVIVGDDARQRRDRVADLVPPRFPQPLDLLVLTTDEWDRLSDRSPGLYAAISSGREI